MRTRKEASSSICTSTACSGMNLGSVVMMVRPAEDWGSSSMARSRWMPSGMWGMTTVSINFLIKVDFPVRTGPTTPM